MLQKSRSAAWLRRSVKRTSSPFGTCVHLSRPRTEDDLSYCMFVANLSKPFKGTTIGMKNPPPGIISCNLARSVPATSTSIGEIDEILPKVYFELGKSRTGSSAGGYVVFKMKSLRQVLDKLTSPTRKKTKKTTMKRQEIGYDADFEDSGDFK